MDRIICFLLTTLIGVQHAEGEYGDRIKNASITWGENLKMEESRHTFALAPYPSPDQHTELPVTFQAPYINARDYWNDPARRTGFDYNPYTLTKPITDGINSFYEMMHQFFGADDQPRYPGPPPAPYRPPPYPQHFPGRPYYIPQPKPIRAQIQKLEPPRKHAQVYQDTPSNAESYPHFVKILNEVLEETPYKYNEPVLEKPDYIYEYIVPTTYKPPNRFRYSPSTPGALPVSIQDKLPPVKKGENTEIPYVTETTTSQGPTARPANKIAFPPQTEFVPQLDYAIDVRNAPLTAKKQPSTPPPIYRPATTSQPLANIDNSPEISTKMTAVEITTDGETGVHALGTTPFPITSSIEPTEQVTKLAEESAKPDEDTTEMSDILHFSTTIRNPQPTTQVFSEANTVLPAKLDTAEIVFPSTTTETSSTLNTQPNEISTVTELLATMEPLERRRILRPFPKKLHSRRVTTDATTSADYVTDLTVEGLADATVAHASVPRYLNTPNVTSVIGYVLHELNATAPPFDDGSLDAKILEDTNWDGFQSTVPTPKPTTVMTTLDYIRDMTEKRILAATTTVDGLIETSTEEIVLLPTTTVPPTTSPAIITTTELPDAQTAVVPLQKQVVVATRMTKSISRGGAKLTEDYPSPRNIEDNEIHELEATTVEPAVTTLSSTSTTTETKKRSRKYQRRHRVQSFTPRPKNETITDTPVRFSASRPFQPRRSRPNATLTFSNRANRRNDESSEKRPVRTEEDERKLRNLYRRRNYPSPLRRSSTTEGSVPENPEMT